MVNCTGEHMNVRTFRLINGDVLIAKEDDIAEKVDGAIAVVNPAIIFLKNTADGKTDGVMAPYMPFAKDGRVTIFWASIAAECEPAEKLVNEYSRLFGSGLEILTKEEAAQILSAAKVQ
jgi:hypothetical protein